MLVTTTFSTRKMLTCGIKDVIQRNFKRKKNKVRVDPFELHPAAPPNLKQGRFTKYAVYTILAEQLEQFSRSGISDEMFDAVRNLMRTVYDKMGELKENE